MSDKEIREIILHKLSEIEKKEDVKILHCVESGSRAWGFASPDSDYDVRFIYLRRPEYYLRLEDTRDVIEWQLDDTLDINGWDFRKALILLQKSNPTLFEWNVSPIVYKTTPEWASLNDSINRHFLPKKGIYHYLNTARATTHDHLRGDTVKLKKYFYALRPLLACKWILDRGTPPPTLFSELVEAYLEPEMLPLVQELVEAKVNTAEQLFSKRIQPLNDYIETQIEVVSNNLTQLVSDEKLPWTELDEIFLRFTTGENAFR